MGVVCWHRFSPMVLLRVSSMKHTRNGGKSLLFSERQATPNARTSATSPSSQSLRGPSVCRPRLCSFVSVRPCVWKYPGTFCDSRKPLVHRKHVAADAAPTNRTIFIQSPLNWNKSSQEQSRSPAFSTALFWPAPAPCVMKARGSSADWHPAAGPDTVYSTHPAHGTGPASGS